MIEALFPRVFLDANREPYELDQSMFAEALPNFANTTSARVSLGLGTIARVVSNGSEIYRRRLMVAEAEAQIEGLYFPYHTALKQLLLTARAHFGGVVLVDCHSMPSTGGPMDEDSGRARGDMVLGDRYGMSCDPRVVELAERTLRRMGYRVTRNEPYAGGFVTQNYGRPHEGLHALQIEINRALYMDEVGIRPNAGYARLKNDVAALIAEMGKVDPAWLAPAGERFAQAAQ